MKSKQPKAVDSSRKKRTQLHQKNQSSSSSPSPSNSIRGKSDQSCKVNKSSYTDNNHSLESLCKTSSGRKNSVRDSYKNSSYVKSEDEEEEDEDQLGAEKYDALFQTVRERREQLVERLRIYNDLFKFHKAMKEDQIFLYRKLQEMDELYLRNTAAILRLGFCPCLVHQQTSAVGDSLMQIHSDLRVWEKKMEDICDILKEPATRKTTTAVLQILNICDSNIKFAQKPDFSDIALPEIVWDLDNPFLEQISALKLTEDWRKVRLEVRENLCEAETTFQEICLEFGITRGPASNEPETRPFMYDNVSMSAENDEVCTTQQSCNKDDNGTTSASASGVDIPVSQVSSSFF